MPREGGLRILLTMLSPKTSSTGFFERSKQHSVNSKRFLLLNSPNDKDGFKIMNRIIAVRCAKWVVFSFQHFSGGILDRGKGCVVISVLRAGKRWIGVETAWSGPA